MVAKKKEEVTQSSSPSPEMKQRIDMAKFSEVMVNIVNLVNSLKEKAEKSDYRMKVMELELADVKRRNEEYKTLLESIKKD